MLSCLFLESYQKGSEVWFKYSVNGTDEEIKRYQLSNLYIQYSEKREPLFVTKIYKGSKGILKFTTSLKPNHYYIDSHRLSVIESECTRLGCDFYVSMHRFDCDNNWLLCGNKFQRKEPISNNNSGQIMVDALIRTAFAKHTA